MENNNQSAALQWHYRILQAMALEEDIPEIPDDKTIPKYRQIDKVRSIQSHSPSTTLLPPSSHPPSPFIYLNRLNSLDSAPAPTPQSGV